MESGISVYLGLEDYSLKQNLEYLKLAEKLGVNLVFSSLHINEASYDFSEFNTMVKTIKDLGLKLCVDISKPAFEKMTISNEIYRLRLDYGFTKEDIVDLSLHAPYMLELNASTAKEPYVQELVKMGVNVDHLSFSFNFYPKKYTGHDSAFVLERTRMLKSFGFKVYAFVNSHEGFRPPLYEGLPTIESHRDESLIYAINELKALGLDGLYFGDAYASTDEIKTLVEEVSSPVLTLEVKSFDPICQILTGEYYNRSDANETLVRLSNYKNTDVIHPQNAIDRKKYSLTIDNEGFKRYSGEVNIVLKDLPKDERVNVIGQIYCSDMVMSMVKCGKHFKFKVK